MSALRLRHVAQINPPTPEFDAASGSTEVTFVPLEAVWPRALDVSRVRQKVDVSIGYTRFREGDILVPKITPTFEADRTTIARGLANGFGAGTTELHVVRTGPQVNTRFVSYLLSSWPFLKGGEAEMIGVAGQKRVPDAWLRDLPVPVTDLDNQRTIADFLDVETARIDSVVAKKRRMLDVLNEARLRALEAAFSRAGVILPAGVDREALVGHVLPPGWRLLRLGTTLLQLTNGYVGPTRDILRDEGVRYIQGLHLKRSAIDFARRPFFVDKDWHDARPRTALRPGDVLIVQTGDIGQCAVVPEGFGEANCHALLIARVNPALITPAYLGAYLQSLFGRQALLRLATGALHPHLEFGIRDALLLVPTLEVQATLVAEVNQRVARIDSAAAKLSLQVELLREHRQTLITAAVMGEIEIQGTAA